MAKQKVISLGRMNCNKTSAFGQSTTVTPVQMIQAQSAFLIKGICLNRGLWIVLKIQFPKDVLSRRKIAGKPITASTASKVETELDKVVNSKKSYAMNYRVDGYDIEGKTGTAQVADEKGMKGIVKKNPKLLVMKKNDQEAYEI